MKILLDCNILVSASISGGNCLKVFKKVLSDHTVYYSDSIFEEYFEVSQRKKFDKEKYMPKISYFVKYILRYAEHIQFVSSSQYISPDGKDQRYLNLAEEVEADYIVTGNERDFPNSPYGQTKIISPKEFLEL